MRIELPSPVSLHNAATWLFKSPLSLSSLLAEGALERTLEMRVGLSPRKELSPSSARWNYGMHTHEPPIAKTDVISLSQQFNLKVKDANSKLDV
jgi:hypothetical protein